jgi:hypothetical protein
MLDALRAECDRVVRRLMRHRDRYLRAWIAATGLHPTEAMLEEHLSGSGSRTVVVRRGDGQKDLVDRLARLLERLQWNDAPDCDACPVCLMPAAGVGHAAGCELAAALRAAGVEVNGGR